VSVLVEASDLHLSLGGASVLQGVDLTLTAGAELGLVGRSGSGKSTLLLLLAGLLRPDRGEIRWPGLSDDPLVRRGQLAMVFQAPSLLSELTAAQNVALPLRLRGEERASAYTSAEAALDEVGLRAAGSAMPEELSGGQQQRVALARVLAGDPLVLLADEPTGALDTATAHRILTVVRRHVADRGGALILATHDEAIADKLATRAELRDGRLVGALHAREAGVRS
jgi:ABC-type lipoprotein export system ATPase subunit